MKYLFFALFMLPLCGIAQKRNSLVLTGALIDNHTRYHFRKYSGSANTLREFDASYYRQLGSYKTWYLGAGFGMRKISINEFNSQEFMDENIVVQPVFGRLAIRYEQFLGRKIKYFLDGGPGYNLVARIRTFNAAGDQKHDNTFIPSLFCHVLFGIKVNMTEAVALGLSFSSLNDLENTLVINDRKVKFSNTTIKAGVQFNF